VEINHPLLFGIGTGLWALALVALVALDLFGVYRAGSWIWVCAVGVVLGTAGVIYSRHSWRARRD
jgi:hypothetical protein